MRLERRAGVEHSVGVLDPRELEVMERRVRAAERAHAISLVSAVPGILLACWFDLAVIAATLVIANVVLHLYPVLVQRQTRVRVSALSARRMGL